MSTHGSKVPVAEAGDGSGACLICDGSNIITDTEASSSSTTQFGERVSPVLSKGLNVYFVLKHVLELPPEQLENYLRQCPSLENWIKICVACSENYVDKCRGIFLEMAEIKRKFTAARLGVIGAIRKSMEAEAFGAAEVGSMAWGDKTQLILDLCLETRRFVKTNDYGSLQIRNPFIAGDLLAKRKLFARKVTLQTIKTSTILGSGGPDEIIISSMKEQQPTRGSTSELKVEHDPPSSHIGNHIDGREPEYSEQENSSCEDEIHDDDWSADNPSENDTDKSVNKKTGSSTSKKLSYNKRNSSNRKGPEHRNKYNYHKSKPRLNCEHCDSSFLTPDALKRHQIRVHKVNLYQCTQCEKEFRQKRQLQDHIKSHHGNEKDLESMTCPQCKRIFTSSLAMKTHQKRTCIAVNPPKPFCPEAGRQMRPKNIMCAVCGKKFSEDRYLDVHMKRFHGNEKDLKELTCPTCQKIYGDKNTIKRHISRSHEGGVPRFPCEHCEKEYAMKPFLVSHMAIAHGIKDLLRYHCSYCGKSFYLKSRLKHHEDIHKAPQHECAICKKLFRLRDNLKFHMISMHGKKLNKDGQLSEGSSDAVQCPTCGRGFPSDVNLRIHIKNVHDNRFHSVCDLCGKVLKSRKSLTQHKAMVHRIGRELLFKFPCEWEGCSKIFVGRGLMRQHIRLYHEKDRPFQCQECGKKMVTEKILRFHIEKHHTDKERKPLKCEECGKRYSSKKSLSIHQRNYHPK